jgi:ribosome-binding factor A
MTTRFVPDLEFCIDDTLDYENQEGNALRKDMKKDNETHKE